MDPLSIYLVFALTTGICCWLFYYVPIVNEAKRSGISNTFTRSPIISSFTYIIISTLVAPSLIIPLFSQEKGEMFRKALEAEILKQD